MQILLVNKIDQYNPELVSFQDGAFLIRDSSKGCNEQPYTLMVLHQYKVYNIQIRFHGNRDGYSLGTGLKGIEVTASVYLNTSLMNDVVMKTSWVLDFKMGCFHWFGENRQTFSTNQLHVSQNFSSVVDMVTHHMDTPLFLIDGMDRGAGPQRECCLMHPAGF